MSRRHPILRVAIPAMVFGTLLIVAVRPGAARPRPQTPDDREQVRRTVLNYVEGFYEGDSTKLVSSIRPEFYKYGFARARGGSAYEGMRMTWEQAMTYARNVKANNRQAPPTAAKVVEIFEVQDQTAAAKLTASWGTDYFLLGKYDGKWMISHVIWQSPPPAAAP